MKFFDLHRQFSRFENSFRITHYPYRSATPAKVPSKFFVYSQSFQISKTLNTSHDVHNRKKKKKRKISSPAIPNRDPCKILDFIPRLDLLDASQPLTLHPSPEFFTIGRAIPTIPSHSRKSKRFPLYIGVILSCRSNHGCHKFEQSFIIVGQTQFLAP